MAASLIDGDTSSYGHGVDKESKRRSPFLRFEGSTAADLARPLRGRKQDASCNGSILRGKQWHGSDPKAREEDVGPIPDEGRRRLGERSPASCRFARRIICRFVFCSAPEDLLATLTPT